MARDSRENRYYYDPGEDLDMPEYQGPDTGDQESWATGLTTLGGAGMTTAGVLAATGVAAPVAGVVAGLSGLAMLGGALLGHSASESQEKAQAAYEKEMLEYQKAYSEKEMAHLEKEAMRKARRDALQALKSRNIYV